jgi:hypothetical protein
MLAEQNATKWEQVAFGFCKQKLCGSIFCKLSLYLPENFYMFVASGLLVSLVNTVFLQDSNKNIMSLR